MLSLDKEGSGQNIIPCVQNNEGNYYNHGAWNFETVEFDKIMILGVFAGMIWSDWFLNCNSKNDKNEESQMRKNLLIGFHDFWNIVITTYEVPYVIDRYSYRKAAICCV